MESVLPARGASEGERDVQLDIPETRDSDTPTDLISADSTEGMTPDEHVAENPQSEGIEHSIVEPRRSTRIRKPPERFEEQSYC